MFELYAGKNRLVLRRRETVTSSFVNAYRGRFEFSKEWADLDRRAVFRCGDKFASAALDENGECSIPWEVLAGSGRRLETGVYGTRGEETVLPTIWANLGMVLTGASLSRDGAAPKPERWEGALMRKGDGLGCTESGELGLYAGEMRLSSVPTAGMEAASCGNGGCDHLVSIWDADGDGEAKRQRPIRFPVLDRRGRREPALAAVGEQRSDVGGIGSTTGGGFTHRLTVAGDMGKEVLGEQ